MASSVNPRSVYAIVVATLNECDVIPLWAASKTQILLIISQDANLGQQVLRQANSKVRWALCLAQTAAAGTE